MNISSFLSVVLAPRITSDNLFFSSCYQLQQINKVQESIILVRRKIESDADGMITYSPLKSWSGTERFGYTISDGRVGIATAAVTVIVQNHPPEDQDISVNANSPIKIKLEAKDPDNDKLKFVLATKPSHGRIVQFSSLAGTLAYIPAENYDGKDKFTFKVHDGTVFSKDAKVSIKIENNVKSSKDQVNEVTNNQANKTLRSRN